METRNDVKGFIPLHLKHSGSVVFVNYNNIVDIFTSGVGQVSISLGPEYVLTVVETLQEVLELIFNNQIYKQ